jgi:hypothetical protein
VIDDKLIGSRYPEHGVVWPVREGENTYTNATALANVIEQVCTAESAEQLDLLQRYAFDRIPEISVWRQSELQRHCHPTSVLGKADPKSGQMTSIIFISNRVIQELMLLAGDGTPFDCLTYVGHEIATSAQRR